MSEPAPESPKPALDLSGLDVEEAVLRLVTYAVDMPASDIFLSAYEDHSRISVRHLGMLKPLMTVALRLTWPNPHRWI